MPDSPAFILGLLTWYRPDLPLTFASRLSPGKPTCLLSLTTSFACLVPAIRLPAAECHSACSCSVEIPLLVSFTSPTHLLCRRWFCQLLCKLWILTQSSPEPLSKKSSSSCELSVFPFTTLVEQIKTVDNSLLTSSKLLPDLWSTANLLAYHPEDPSSNPAIPTCYTLLLHWIWCSIKTVVKVNLLVCAAIGSSQYPLQYNLAKLWTQHTIPHHWIALRELKAFCSNMRP